jgi:hypothetical protein
MQAVINDNNLLLEGLLMEIQDTDKCHTYAVFITQFMLSILVLSIMIFCLVIIECLLSLDKLFLLTILSMIKI